MDTSPLDGAERASPLQSTGLPIPKHLKEGDTPPPSSGGRPALPAPSVRPQRPPNRSARARTQPDIRPADNHTRSPPPPPADGPWGTLGDMYV